MTGVRRSGKSYLLFNLFSNWLINNNIPENHIIKVDLEDRRNKALRDPDALLEYIDSKMVDSDMYYILIDEIQHVAEFEDVLNSYLKVKNADVYVTGSNARFLSKDIITTFRGRGYVVHIYPLGYSEYHSSFEKAKEETLSEYLLYGGLPETVFMSTAEEKVAFYNPQNETCDALRTKRTKIKTKRFSISKRSVLLRRFPGYHFFKKISTRLRRDLTASRLSI